MRIPSLATRLLFLAALSSFLPTTACAQTPAPEEPVATPQPPAAPQSPLSPHAAQLIDQDQQLKQKQKAIRDMQLALEKQSRALEDASRNFDSSNVFFATADRPALLITHPIDGRAMEEWTEDLKIMDKLLRSAITRSNDEDTPTAMGIRLTTLGRVPPTYIEDAGALFTLGVNFPLAPSSNTDKSAQPAEPESPWDRAKRDLDNRDTPPRPERRAALLFEQSRVDNLLNALLTTLPQAANFRHLSDNEFVIITITSTDTARNPLRLTLKAKKSDINQANSKSLSPDEFKKRVPWHIG